MKEQMLRICHDDILAGHFFLENSILSLKNTVWWLGCKADMEEYISTCDSCQKGREQIGKRFGLLQEIQKSITPWEMINMDFITRLPILGNLSYNSFLGGVCRMKKKVKSISVHKGIDSKGFAFVWWSYMLNEAGLPLAIISDRDPKFTTEFWKFPMNIMGF